MFRERIISLVGIALILLGAAGASGSSLVDVLEGNFLLHLVYFSSGLVAVIFAMARGKRYIFVGRGLLIVYASLGALGFIFPEDEILGVLSSGYWGDIVNVIVALLLAVATLPAAKLR